MPTVFKIEMDNLDDIAIILKGSPWIFRNTWLVLQEYNGISPISYMEFTKPLTRVQLWDSQLMRKHVKLE